MLQPNTFTKLARFVTLRRIDGPRNLSANTPALQVAGSFLRAIFGAQDAQIGPRELERVVRRASRFRTFAGVYIRLSLTLRALRVAEFKDRCEMIVDLKNAFA